MKTTTIQVQKQTLEKLKLFKKHERESYEEVINSLMEEVEEEALNEEEIKDIQEALEEVKQGKTIPIEQVAKELGISLV
jgi:predicted CopG family antitoxin